VQKREVKIVCIEEIRRNDRAAVWSASRMVPRSPFPRHQPPTAEMVTEWVG
jgi:hypothetical protein